MPLNPKESCQARAEIRQRNYVAASLSPPPASSPAQGTRDPQPGLCRGDDPGQRHPFPLGIAPGQRITSRSVRPIAPATLRQIFRDEAQPVPPMLSPPPTWMQIGVSALAVAALVLFVFFLDGGWIPLR